MNSNSSNQNTESNQTNSKSAGFNNKGQRIMPHSPDQVLNALGSVLWLVQHSEIHKLYPVSLLLSRVLPPMEFGQFQIFYNSKKVPIGFCSWARLSEERYNAITKNEREMEYEDWNSGNIPFIAELVAPFGNMKKIAKMLREQVFKGELVTSIKVDKSSIKKSNNNTTSHKNYPSNHNQSSQKLSSQDLSQNNSNQNSNQVKFRVQRFQC